MIIDKKKLLFELECVMPGIATKETIEQATCFVFKNNTVMTYNDEIACQQTSSLPFEGAVKALPLISILRKLTEKEIDVSVVDENIVIKGKRKTINIIKEAGIKLPVNSIEKPEKWKVLPDIFIKAISLVGPCASKDATKFVLTCVNITKHWVEACDGFQATRYLLDMDIKKSLLIRAVSIKYILSLDMIKYSETENWFHFKNAAGLILSCRKWTEEFPDISDILKTKGTPIKFPTSIIKAIDKAQVFSLENVDENQIDIIIDNGKLIVEGNGVSGKYRELSKIDFKRSYVAFKIEPAMLVNLIKQNNECQITEQHLVIRFSNYTYITVMDALKTTEKKSKKKAKKK